MIQRYRPFLEKISTGKLSRWAAMLPEQIAWGLDPERFGDVPKWTRALDALPAHPVAAVHLDQGAVGVQAESPLSLAERGHFIETLKKFHPWRKGPFELFGVRIDTEWRSDWKWQRVIEHVQPLEGRKVLDVGCGSGYHCWRMRGEGASLVVGIDPTPLYVMQFFCTQEYIQDHSVAVLPMKMEAVPAELRCFDTVFSMGVLYHRRGPLEHLIELRESLRHGGEVVLETLVTDGPIGHALMPAKRYAKMNNVWFLPSTATLASWMERVGFRNVRVVDVNTTSLDEQRSTDWMTFQSLRDFLDPTDPSKTVEGYPAPKRAVLIADRP